MEQRIHRLIKQGGLIDMVGLNTIDKLLMAGLLVDCKKRLDFMTEEQKYELRNLGYLTMKARKGKKHLDREKTKIKPFKFWENQEVQSWQKLM
jgi:hypothetical protein